MCGLFASFSDDKVAEFAGLNAERGSLTSTLSVIHNGSITIDRRMGNFEFVIPQKGFKVGHIQSPTGSHNGLETSHPSVSAQFPMSYLWHNGMLKEHQCDKLRSILKTEEKWDTKLMHQYMKSMLLETALSSLNGSFACFYIVKLSGNFLFFVFRNSLAPLFYTDDLSFSSVSDGYMKTLPANIVFKVDLEKKKMTNYLNFTTFENPYYGLED